MEHDCSDVGKHRLYNGRVCANLAPMAATSMLLNEINDTYYPDAGAQQENESCEAKDLHLMPI